MVRSADAQAPPVLDSGLGGGDDSVRAVAAAELEQLFDRIEGALAKREWLAGEERSAADLFLFMVTRWGRHLDSPAWERPSLREHWLRTLELPGVEKMMEEQGLELPAFA